jgi:predicted transcriptional regulator/DNA polymerase IIIc chi subunit
MERLQQLKKMQKSFELGELHKKENRPTNWTPIEKIKKSFDNFPFRQMLENEMIIEIDKPTLEESKAYAEKIKPRLVTKGITFEVWTTQNKSCHIHLFFNRKLTDEERLAFMHHIFSKEEMEEIWTDRKGEQHEVLDSNYWTKNCRQFIALGGAEHYKSKKPKILLTSFGEKLNKFPDLKLPKEKPEKEKQKSSKVVKTIRQILEDQSPKEKERVSLVEKIRVIHSDWNEETIADYISEGNKWKNYDPEKTYNKIKAVMRTYTRDAEEEEIEKEYYELSEIEAIVKKNFPAIWEETKIFLSIPCTLLLKDISNPIGMIIEGPPSGNKTTIMSFAYGMSELFYKSDDFTPRSFVTHASNVKAEKLKEIDLLPRIKDKVLLVPELAPMFSRRKDDLIEVLGVLTRVFDGEGLTSDSGTRGRRGYEGEYLFAFVGATTPLSKGVWDVIGKLGNRWVFLSMKKCNKSEDYLVKDVLGEKEFKRKIASCRVAIQSFLKNLFEHYGGHYAVIWDRKNDNDEVKRKLVRLTELVVRLRAPVKVWKEKDDTSEAQYSFTQPIIEEPERLITLFYNIARGHALLNKRTKTNKDDWQVCLKVGLSTMPYERAQMFNLLLKHKGKLTSIHIQEELNCSQGNASKIMKQLEVLQLVDKETATGDRFVLQIELKEEYRWILEEEVGTMAKEVEESKEEEKKPEEGKKT